MAKQEQKTDFPRLALYVAGGFLLYKIAKKLGGFIQDPLGNEQANADLENSISVNEANLTYGKWQYNTWANALETALLLDIDEDETAVDGVIFQLHNDDDWKQLVLSFGVRQDYNLGFVPGAQYSLPAAIRILMPERINDYNNHFAGWNMQSRI